MNERKRKANINLAPNFKEYNPQVSAEVLTRRNERKLIRTKNNSDLKSVVTRRTTEQCEKRHSIFDDEIRKQIIVGHPHLLYIGCKKAECLMKLKDNCPWPWDEIISVSSTTATAGTSSTKLARSSSADENNDSVKEEGANNTIEASEAIPEEA